MQAKRNYFSRFLIFWTFFAFAGVLCNVVHANAAEALMGIQPENEQTTATNQADAEVRHTLSSPRAVVENFLLAMDDNWWNDTRLWDRAVDALNFPPNSDITDAQKRRHARDLYLILGRINPKTAEIPNHGEAERRNLTRYTLFPREDVQSDQELLNEISGSSPHIFLQINDAGRWQFSAETVENIPDYYRQMIDLPIQRGRHFVTVTEWMEQYLPAWTLRGEALSVEYWKWTALLGFIFLGLVADFIVRIVLKLATIRQSLKRGIEPPPSQDLKRSVRPFGMAFAAVIWLAGLRIVGLVGLPFLVINAALQVFIVLAGVLAAWRVTDILTEMLRRKAEKTATRVDNALVPLLQRALKIFIVIIGIIYAAGVLDINVWPLIASLSIGAVAFGFAAKDTVENFFGSIAVLLDRPFDVGDWVTIGDTEGIVEQVGFRSTRIRTFYNSQVSVPNANLVRAVVDNYGRRKFRRWSTKLGVQYDTTPDQLLAFCEGIRELIRLHPYTRKDFYFVHCNEFGDFSLQILLYVFFEVPDWNTELRERDRLFRDIVRLADQLNVKFAFPTHTVHLFQEQKPDASQPYQPRFQPPKGQEDRHAIITGARAAKQITANQPDVQHKPGPATVIGAPLNINLDDAGNPIIEPDTPNTDNSDK